MLVKLSKLTSEGRNAGVATRGGKANQNNQRTNALIRGCRENGMSFAQIAGYLNKNDFHIITDRLLKKCVFQEPEMV